ncbi:MAG: nicotinamide-nucleotide amidohydrolase family protein [Burkholderiales bacterium]|jgi:nicotinamide-nucleotide amidase|nr:nicotinamide-nucleotide amidohydrolase family protein [Burkholderiales bacterium]
MAKAQRRIVEVAEAVGRALLARRMWLATAESCTAGGVAYAVTQIAGSSRWFDRGFVTYSNAAKRQMLGVSAVDLRLHGAVSEPVARAMARGALVASDAHIAVGITGIAGPGGGTAEKPVGLVCFCWALRRAGELRLRTESRRLAGDRAAVRTDAIVIALDGLLQTLEENSDV